MFPEVATDKIKTIEKELVDIAKMENEPKRAGNTIGLYLQESKRNKMANKR